MIIFGFLGAIQHWRLLGTASDHWAIKVSLGLLAFIVIPLLLASLIGLFWQTFKGLHSFTPSSSTQPTEKDSQNCGDKSKT